MENSSFFYGGMVILSFFLAFICAAVIPAFLTDKGKRAKKAIKFIAPLAPVIILIAATLPIFLEETRWVSFSLGPYTLVTIGTLQLFSLLAALYFSGWLILQLCK